VVLFPGKWSGQFVIQICRDAKATNERGRNKKYGKLGEKRKRKSKISLIYKGGGGSSTDHSIGKPAPGKRKGTVQRGKKKS